MKKGKTLIVRELSKRNNWWYCQRSPGYGNHPATFPEKLAEDHIISWSNPGDVVLDPFMGSGTTAKVAIDNGRKYIGFDVSADYCDMARARIKCMASAAKDRSHGLL